jgi:hypothetical protein
LNYIRAEFIEQRIEELLPPQNFYFHKDCKGDTQKLGKGDSQKLEKRIRLENRDLERLVDVHLSCDRYYLAEG